MYTTIKGVGRIYQQTFVDTYSTVADAKLYTKKTPITAAGMLANMLNDEVIPFYDEHRIKILRILTDRGTEFCGKLEHHAFDLFLSMKILTIPEQSLFPAN